MGKLLNEVDFHQQAFLYETPPEVERCGGSDTVRLVSRGSSNVTLQADMACRGMVVLADTYYPGWHATVDGAPATICEAYGGIRGVVVDAGAHEIRMVYRPLSIIVGAVLTLAGFLGMAVLLVMSRRRGAGRSALPS